MSKRRGKEQSDQNQPPGWLSSWILRTVQERNKNRTQYNSKRGIIFDVEEEITSEELQTALGIPVERIIKKKHGETIRTKQMILHFKNEIPDYVYIGWRRFKVSTYIPEPVRCYNCQKFGHRANNCNSREVCPICSGKHNYNNCPMKTDYRVQERARCPKGRGPHPASYKGCTKYQQAKKLLKLRRRKESHTPEAVKTVRNKKQRETRRKQEIYRTTNCWHRRWPTLKCRWNKHWTE